MENYEVYDQDGHLLDHYDLDKGYLKFDIKVIHHDAIEGVEQQGHYETVHEYPNGGKEVKWVVDVQGVEARAAWDEKRPVYIYILFTPEELAEYEHEKKEKAEMEQFEKAVQEAQVALLTSQINTITVDDSTALRWRPLYPKWEENVTYAKNIKVQYKENLYKCLQEHTSQVGWEPINTPALWTEITETHSGTLDDPIPYNNNMALENGKYYIQDNVKYYCIRDTGIPVYNPLKDLINIYVEVVL